MAVGCDVGSSVCKRVVVGSRRAVAAAAHAGSVAGRGSSAVVAARDVGSLAVAGLLRAAAVGDLCAATPFA